MLDLIYQILVGLFTTGVAVGAAWASLKGRIAVINERVRGVDERVEGVSRRLNRMEDRLDRHFNGRR